MPRVKITHEYYLDIPEDQVLEGLDSVLNAGVSMMENHMRQLSPNIEVRSSWKQEDGWTRHVTPAPERELPTADVVILPEEMLDRRGYIKDPLSDSEMSKRLIDQDLDSGINFTEDILQGGYQSRATHPWDQGLRVFPLTHPLADTETAALGQKGMLCGHLSRIEDYDVFCVLLSGHEGNHQYRSTEDDLEIRRDDGSPPPQMLERGE